MTAVVGTGVVLMAYGTPREPEEWRPYYTDIRRGRPPTPEQLADLVRRYDAIGGVSRWPSARKRRAGLQVELDARRPQATTWPSGSSTPIRRSRSVSELAARGLSDVIGLVLAPHWSALSVAQYLDRAGAAEGRQALHVPGVESWHLEPRSSTSWPSRQRRARPRCRPATTVVFSAHSLPERILTTGDPYPGQLAETADAVASRVGLEPDRWRVAWQSAGRTPEPWLGPGHPHRHRRAGRPGRAGVLVCACGFVADHLEILYDLDIEARQRAEAAGLAFARTACVNDDPGVLGALADLVIALAEARRGRPGGNGECAAAGASRRRHRRRHHRPGGRACSRPLHSRRPSRCSRRPTRPGEAAGGPFAGLPHVDAGCRHGPGPPRPRSTWPSRWPRRPGAPNRLPPYVWSGGRLHRCRRGLVLGVPSRARPAARSRLLSWRGKARAALEPLVPRRDTDDNLGATVRSRFGDEVLERLVGPLVGGINAGDADHLSLRPSRRSSPRRCRAIAACWWACGRCPGRATPRAGVRGAPVGREARWSDRLVSAIEASGGRVPRPAVEAVEPSSRRAGR